MSSVMDPFYLCDTSAALDGGSVNRDFRGPLFSANPSTVAASYPYSQHHKHLQHQQAERVVHQPQLADPTCSSPDEITKTDAGADSCNNMRNARDKSNLPLIKLKRRAQNRAAYVLRVSYFRVSTCAARARLHSSPPRMLWKLPLCMR